MKILIITPLYPPDTAISAVYIKELAKRLAGDHEVTVATYGRIPEKIEGVRIETANKQRPLFIRLINFTFILLREIRKVDVVYTENGPSVELPLSVVSTIFRKPFFLHNGDQSALLYTKHNTLHRLIHASVSSRAKNTIEFILPKKLEILPFGESVAEKVAGYEKSWERHVGELEYNFKQYVG